MKITFETTDLKEADRLISAFYHQPQPVRSVPLPVPTKIVSHNKRGLRGRHRRKCAYCKKGFLGRGKYQHFCSKKCANQSYYRNVRLKAGQPKKKFTRKQLAAVRKNVAKAREALAAKHRAEKKAAKEKERELAGWKDKGAILMKGDPLTPGLNP